MLELAALILVAAVSTTFLLDIVRPALKLLVRRRAPKAADVHHAQVAH